MFSLICAWTNDKANNRDTGNLRRHRTYYDVNVIRSRWPHDTTRKSITIQPECIICSVFWWPIHYREATKQYPYRLGIAIIVRQHLYICYLVGIDNKRSCTGMPPPPPPLHTYTPHPPPHPPNPTPQPPSPPHLHTPPPTPTPTPIPHTPTHPTPDLTHPQKERKVGITADPRYQ